MFVSYVQSNRVIWHLLLLAAVACAMPESANAQSSSELLEKAVYAEETAGNLDQAIDLYGQVIAEGKANMLVAAEAQYRLGLCLEKQGKDSQAEEAFQAVVDNFPKAEKFVGLARKHLPGPIELLPVPWKSGEQMFYAMELPNGMEIGTQICTIDATELNGKPVWRCSNRVYAMINNANSFSEAFCDKETFAPIKSYWSHSLLGVATATYDESKVSIEIANREEPIVHDYTSFTDGQLFAYDNEQCIQMFRRLPLEIGYHAKIPIVATIMGNVFPLEVDVPKKKSITTTLGTYDCYQLELNIGQIFWISDDEHRYLVRFEAGGVSADMTRVEHRSFEESKQLDEEAYSITLPAGWFSFVPSNDADDGDHDVFLLDRRAEAVGRLRIFNQNVLDKDVAPPQAWGKKFLAKAKGDHADLKVRGTGPQNITVGGQQGVKVVFDFKDKANSMTGFGLAVFEGEMVAGLQFVMPTEKYEELQVDFDALANSLKLK